MCEKMSNKKERQTTKQENQEHRNTAPLSLQIRSYKKDWCMNEKIASKANNSL